MNKNHINSGEYSIECAGRDKNYIGETSRSIKKRIYLQINVFGNDDARNV